MSQFPNVTGPLNQPQIQSPSRSAAQTAASPSTPARPVPDATLPTQSVVNVGGPRPESNLAANSVSFDSPKAANSETSLDAVLAQLDPSGEVRQFVQAVGSNQTGPAPQLNLTQGMNYNVSQLFAQTDSRSVNQLTQALNSAASGAELSEADTQALRKIGLMVHDGGVYNLANRQPLSSQDLGNMAQLANHRLTSLTSDSSGARVLNQSGAELQMREIGPRLSQASANLDALQEMQGLLAQNAEEIATQRKAVEDNGHQIEEQQDVAQESVAVARTEEEKLDYLKDLDARSTEDAAEPLSTPETLEQDNEKLSTFGLRIVSDGGSMRLADVSGTILSPEEGNRRLDQAVADQSVTVETARARAQTETERLSALIDQGSSLSRSLEETLEHGKALEADYNARQAASQAEIASLDPNAMTSEQRNSLQNLRQRSGEVYHQGHRVLNQLQQERSHATRTLSNVRQLQAMARAMLPALGDRLVRSIAETNLLPKQDTLTSLNVELLREMLSRVADAEATLNLAPRPAEVDVQKMANEWSDMLQEYSARFNLDTKTQNDNEQVQASFSTAQQRDIRRATEHHSNQLRKLDSHNLERMEQVLREALQGIYQQASASLPVTSVGNR